MSQDWRRTLEILGWYHDEANSSPSYEVWKYARVPGGELRMHGARIDFMEGQVETLQRVVAALEEYDIKLKGQPGDWVQWWRSA